MENVKEDDAPVVVPVVESTVTVEDKFREVDSNVRVVFQAFSLLQQRVNNLEKDYENTKTELSVVNKSLNDVAKLKEYSDNVSLITEKLATLTDSVSEKTFSIDFVKNLVERNDQNIIKYETEIIKLKEELLIQRNHKEYKKTLLTEFSSKNNSSVIKDVISDKLDKMKEELSKFRLYSELEELLKSASVSLEECINKKSMLTLLI
jgi:hypothetical protein